MADPDPLAIGAMVAYCGWDPTASVTSTVALDGNGTRVLALPCLHVTAVTTITVTDQWGTVTTPTIGPALDVGWSENGCLTWNGLCGWPIGQRNIVITYTGGYDDIPDDLEAALESVANRTTSTAFGATSRRLGSASISFGAQVSSGDLLMIERMVFDRYRIPRSA